MVQTRNQERQERELALHESTSPPDSVALDGEPMAVDTDEAAAEGILSPKQHDTGTKGEQTRSPIRSGGKQLEVLLNQIVDKYGKAPFGPLIDDDWPSNKVVMVHILDALLASTPISHEIARTTLAYLIEEDYHDVETLQQATWEEKTDVLTQGGYVRYREKTATFLGDLAELLKMKYDNDATKILPSDEVGEEARKTITERLKEIKGLGPVGIDIFLGSIQYFFPNISPFLDERSLQTAESVGLGHDIESMFTALGSEPLMMAKLEDALTTVRLEKKENELSSLIAA